METPGSIVLPDKPFLTEQQLLEVWEGRGFRFRVDELHKHLRDNGLFPVVNRNAFRTMILEACKTFFVAGKALRDPSEIPPTRFVKD